MKTVVINENEMGVVFKNNKIIKVIEQGKYWFFTGEQISIFNVFKEFKEIDWIDNQILNAYLEIVHITDEALVLVSERGNFSHVLTAGTFAFWKGKHKFSFQEVSIANYQIENVSKAILEKQQLNLYVRSFRVESYEKGLLFVDGNFVQMLEAGNYFWWKNAQTINVAKGDTRLQALEILGQEILTKDKVQLRLNFVIQYQLTDFIKAFVETKEHEKQLYVLVQMALRTLIGTLTFDELMDQKNEIATLVFNEINEKAERLGVSVLDAGLKDVILPGEIREIMNQVLIAEKKAQANSIIRREETASTRSLLNTAKLMDENQMLYKLKEMEYIEKIADKINTISVSGSNNIVSELKQIFTK